MKSNILLNSKGISVLFLIIAMMLMVTIGYVFSYLIPSKQKSVLFPIQSTQAFFLAQSGVEFAIMYAQCNNWTTAGLLNNNMNGVTRNLGSGRFILTYNYATYGDTLISVGEVPTNLPRRSIRISNFTSFLQTQGLKMDPCSPAPYWVNPRTAARFYIKNVGSSNKTLTAFSASWTGPPSRRLNHITMTLGATTNTIFMGTYSSDSGSTNFTPAGNSQTIGPNQVITVDVVFNQQMNPNAQYNIYFYEPSGSMHTFSFLIS